MGHRAGQALLFPGDPSTSPALPGHRAAARFDLNLTHQGTGQWVSS